MFKTLQHLINVLIANTFQSEWENSFFLLIFFFFGQNCILNTAVTQVASSLGLLVSSPPSVFQMFACQAVLWCCSQEEEVFLVRGLWTLVILFLLTFYAEGIQVFFLGNTEKTSETL